MKNVWTLAGYILILIILAIVTGCARTYHIYNFAEGGSSIRQTIRVDALVDKQTDIARDATVSGTP